MNIKIWIKKMAQLLVGKRYQERSFELTQFYPASENIAEMARIKRVARNQTPRKFINY